MLIKPILLNIFEGSNSYYERIMEHLLCIMVRNGNFISLNSKKFHWILKYIQFHCCSANTASLTAKNDSLELANTALKQYSYSIAWKIMPARIWFFIWYNWKLFSLMIWIQCTILSDSLHTDFRISILITGITNSSYSIHEQKMQKAKQILNVAG